MAVELRMSTKRATDNECAGSRNWRRMPLVVGWPSRAQTEGFRETRTTCGMQWPFTFWNVDHKCANLGYAKCTHTDPQCPVLFTREGTKFSVNEKKKDGSKPQSYIPLVFQAQFLLAKRCTIIMALALLKMFLKCVKMGAQNKIQWNCPPSGKVIKAGYTSREGS